MSTENVQPAPSSPLPTSSSRYLDITGDKADDAVSTSLRADRTPGFTPSSYAAPGGKEVLLRIKIPVPGLESVISTVKVTTNTYLADVIETICRKRKEHLGSAKDWVILLADRDILAPTDRTVESLQGSYKLRLMKKDELPGSIKPSQTHGATGNVNPSTSVYKRASEPPQPKYVSASDVSGHTQVSHACLVLSML